MTSRDLTHYGKKGMKWGVRKEQDLRTAQRVASGQGSRRDRLGVKLSATLPELLKNKGDVQKIAAGRAAVLEAQKRRIESGQATRADRFDRALNTPLIDLVRGK